MKKALMLMILSLALTAVPALAQNNTEAGSTQPPQSSSQPTSSSSDDFGGNSVDIIPDSGEAQTSGTEQSTQTQGN